MRGVYFRGGLQYRQLQVQDQDQVQVQGCDTPSVEAAEAEAPLYDGVTHCAIPKGARCIHGVTSTTGHGAKMLRLPTLPTR